jgi:hypothetical protein
MKTFGERKRKYIHKNKRNKKKLNILLIEIEHQSIKQNALM